MKKLLTIALAISFGTVLAQKSDNVGIGTTKPDPSALLDLNSTSKGLLLPRMSEAQRNAIKNPAAGLIVFQTDQAVGTYTYDGTTWQPNARTASTLSVGAWDKQGNAVDATDFVGTTNDFDLIFKRNGSLGGRIGINNSFWGLQAGLNTTGSNNAALGTNALYSNTTGTSNVAIGFNSLFLNSSGGNNVGVGFQTLNANTTGSGNIAIGANAMYSNSTGVNNMGIGVTSLFSNISGGNNTGLGYQALFNNNTGNGNTSVGSNSMLSNTGGSNNMALGAVSLNKNTVGNNNVAIGSNSLENNVSGNTNLALGSQAGFTNISGNGNVFVGYQAGFNETNSNMLYIANSNSINPLIKGSFHTTAPWIRLNVKVAPSTPTPATTGYLAIGDFDTAPGGAGAGGLGLPGSFSGGPYRLYVQDGIMTEKLKVALRNSSDWADYVFAPEYKLLTLEQVEYHIKKYKHLPNVPSAYEMAKNGLDVSATSAKLMEKIEELTLYIIQLQKEVNSIKNKQTY